MSVRSVKAVYKGGHFIPLDDLKLREDSRVIISIVEDAEQPKSQTPDERETAEKEELIRKIMSNTGSTRADVESLFETQGLWLNNPESEAMIQETQKGFEKWCIEEW